MTDKEKLIKIKSLADKMSDTAFNITTNASLLRKAMDEYHQFIINEYHKEEQIIKELQEKPVSSIWHNASEKSNEPEDVVIINPSDNTGEVLTRCVDVYQGRIWAYTSVLLNLDNPCKIGKNLQEEPVSEKKCMFSKDNYTDEDRIVLCEDCNERCEYSKKEEPVSEEWIDVAKQYVKEHVIGIDKVTFSIATDMFISGVKWQKEKDSMFINEDLEKASYLFACKCHPLKTECSTSSPNREVIEAFKTGAKWKEGQMMKNTIDSQCFGFQGAALFSFRLPADNYLVGSKVKVIIIKED